MRKRTALIVVDFQNDFCTSDGVEAEYRGDLSRIDDPARRISAVIACARDSATDGTAGKLSNSVRDTDSGLRKMVLNKNMLE
jgi:hypothetical protein